MKLLIVSVILCLATAAYAAPRIMGGKVAPEGKYPYQVSLRNAVSNRHNCGGSILNDRWILTAAHCVQNQRKIVVVVGTNSVAKGNGVAYDSEYITYHEDYNPSKLINDIALIRVDRDIEFNDKVQPIALAKENFTKVDYPVTLTGWGRLTAGGIAPTELQEITLKVIDQAKCKKVWKWQMDITESHICTLTHSGEGACNGDSGGPLVADGVQVGVVSFGIPCGRGYPDVYSRVPTFYNWINEQIENHDNLIL